MSLGDATIVCVQPSQVCHSIDVLSITSMRLAWVSDNAVLHYWPMTTFDFPIGGAVDLDKGTCEALSLVLSYPLLRPLRQRYHVQALRDEFAAPSISVKYVWLLHNFTDLSVWQLHGKDLSQWNRAPEWVSLAHFGWRWYYVLSGHFDPYNYATGSLSSFLNFATPQNHLSGQSVQRSYVLRVHRLYKSDLRRDRHRPSRPTDGTKDGRPVDRPSTVRWDSFSHGARRDGTVDGTAVDGGRTASQQPSIRPSSVVRRPVDGTPVFTTVRRRDGTLRGPTAQRRDGTVVRPSVRPTVLDGSVTIGSSFHVFGFWSEIPVVLGRKSMAKFTISVVHSVTIVCRLMLNLHEAASLTEDSEGDLSSNWTDNGGKGRQEGRHSGGSSGATSKTSVGGGTFIFGTADGDGSSKGGRLGAAVGTKIMVGDYSIVGWEERFKTHAVAVCCAKNH
ncbi:hypothetical protein DFH08DRAFT_807340 [Mycena albidolilacea]|uniref:Uncharacterized protein n=1 Tax=Mycena albidolilacea TaxID=1033008 RepID=A0AAD7A6F7_9AGAR|nr:hypothetical protein DFH08DRAFT_807340 [Mycena albidolilacea]